MVMNSEGRIAISRAGNDRGRHYLIIGEEGGFAKIADGMRHKLAQPGRKNIRHLSITKTVVKGWEKLVQGEPVSSNLKLAGLLKQMTR